MDRRNGVEKKEMNSGIRDVYDEKPMILKDEYVQIAILDERVRVAVRFDGDVYKLESLDSNTIRILKFLKCKLYKKRKQENNIYKYFDTQKLYLLTFYNILCQ